MNPTNILDKTPDVRHNADEWIREDVTPNDLAEFAAYWLIEKGYPINVGDGKGIDGELLTQKIYEARYKPKEKVKTNDY